MDIKLSMATNFIRYFVEAGDTVFDVGANIGQKADLYLAAGAKVICFEPQPDCLTILTQKYQQNPNAFIVNKGLGEQPGTMQLSVCSDANYISTFSQKWKTGRFANYDWNQTVTVEITTLDEMIKLWGCPKFCKIDVEGFEYQVLKGLSVPIPYISFEFAIEFIEDTKNCINHLKSLGYKVFNIAKGEDSNFLFPEWVADSDLLNYLESANDALLWGDIYAKFEKDRHDTSEIKTVPKISNQIAATVGYLDLHKLCQQYSISPRGVIHIGAHEGQEMQEYQVMGADKVLFVEANPSVFERLKLHIAGIPNVWLANCAISNQNGTVNLRVNSHDMSSSILPLKLHKEIYPGMLEVDQVTVTSKTLDSLMQESPLNSSEFNILVIDIQGAELLALQGARETLKYIDAISTEVNCEELYEGCALIDQVDDFLKVYGFQRVAVATPSHPSWGDAFYVKNTVSLADTDNLNLRISQANNKNSVAIATSIAPGNIENQRAAVESWILLGFEAVSLNSREEISQLQSIYENVTFHEVKRDARADAGRPLVYLDDLFAYLRDSGTKICGIVNSDIRLKSDGDLISFICKQAENSIIFGSRTDVDSPEQAAGEIYANGFDFFFFDKDLLRQFPKSQFCLGLPWWDLWIPLAAQQKGLSVKYLESAIAYHIKHPVNYINDLWQKMGIHFTGFFQPDLSRKFQEMLSKNLNQLDAELISIAVQAGQMIDKNQQRIRYEASEVEFPTISPLLSSNKKPFWSVMIPTYNLKGNYLEQTLKSVIEQAPFIEEMQIEVVNDHPSRSVQDEIAAIIKKVGGDRIKFYRHSETNVGQTAIFNICIQQARGQWVHILHDDDFVKPGFYSSLRNSIEQQLTIGAAFCRCVHVNEENAPLWLSPLERETPGILTDWLKKIAVYSWIAAASMVVKRSVYEELGGFCPQAGAAADWEMWKRIAVHYPMWYEPQMFACTRMNSSSWTSRLFQLGENIAEARKAIEISQSYLPKESAEELSNQAREHYAIEALKMAHSMLSRGEVNYAIAQIREGLKCSTSAQVMNLLPAVFASSETAQNPRETTPKIKPRIIIDGVMFQIHNSGISRVWYSLIIEWASQSFSQHILVLDRNGTTPKIAGINYRQVPAYDYNNTEGDREMLQQICDEEQADLFISTYYTTPRSTPSVFMAYDMIPEVMAANLANPMWTEKHQGIRHASAYIAISENTASDLVKCFPEISPESVTVAHCGIDKAFSPLTFVEVNQFKTKYGISKPYFLWVGDRVGFNGYKNAILFFKAFSKLERKHDFEIVCAGGNPVLETELQTYVATTKFHLLKLSDDELRSAYSGAVALVQTSKYEGFGLPILEAIACGCPVIACTNSSIPEVAGQAALYVKSEDVEELKKALIEVQKPDIRQSLIAVGLEQAKKFSWSEMATKVSSALIAATKLPAKKSVAVPVSITDLISIAEQYNRNSLDKSALVNARQARKQIAEIWLNLPTAQLATTYAGDTGKLHQLLLNSEIRDEPLTDTEQTFISELTAYIAKGFNDPKAINYLLAAMLYRRADQLPLKYDRAQIPNWFANDYLKFMFASPNLFQTVGEADNYYQFILGWVNYIHSNIFKNPDSQLWQNIALFFSQAANFIPLYFTTANLRDIYTKRADIIEFALKNRGSSIDCIFPGRSPNRTKIRLGIINDHFTPQTETFATIPVFEHLNRDQFEIVLYALNTNGHQLEQYCQSRADKLVTLPQDFASQVQTIRADDLDILFFGTNLTAVNKPLVSLAMHRLARVQTTSFCSPTTTGIRHIDYYIAGKYTVPDASYQEQYREQLAVMEGSGFCFKYATESEVATVKPTRQSLGIDDNTTVFISGANFYKILPELRETWVKILAAVPNSILILYPFGPAWTRSYPATPFVNNLNAVCAKYGVNNNRLRFVKQLPSRADVKEFLQLADVYLDSYPYAGATSLIDPLQVGLPTVVVEGNALRFRQGSAMLRELQMPDLITNSEASYIQLAVTLGTNPQLRQRYRQEIQQKMQANPACFDSVAYSGAIAQLFQQLFGKWQTGHQATSRILQDSIPKVADLGDRLSNTLKLYQTNPSNTSAISQLRQIRKQTADFWLNVPADNLETIYKGDSGKSYQILLASGFQHQPMMEDEQRFLQQLTQISKGLVHPQAINALLAAMLYFPPGTMRIPEARNRLPHWLIGDYEQVFEPKTAVNSESSSELLAQYIQSPQFANQLLGCVNLYRIDSSDASVVLELRQLRRQLADFWLTIPPEKLATFYQGEVRKGYQAILGCGLQAEAMTEAEQQFLQQLTDISKGLVHPQAINALLGAMLYFVPGTMRVPDANTRLPQWLFDDYEKVFESVFAQTEETIVQQNYLPQFLNQLTAGINLYEIDATAELVIADLRQIRQQISDLWLSVSEEQLEVLYRSDFGKGYKAILASRFINEPLNETERAVFNSLVAELSQGFGRPKAVNYLLATMLFCRAGQLRVEDANTCLPGWLLADYEQFVGGAVKVAVG
jgi:FkbM family methyltransferase